MMNLSWRHFGVLAACLLVVDVHARAPELGETLGIGELLDGSFLVVSSGGRAKEVEVPRSLFFTASSMASDGRFIVGYSDRGFTVLNQNLRPVWSRPDPPYNVIALALSADGMQIAVAAADLWAARWTATTWKLFTISSSRRQRDIGRFSYTRSADELVTVNWDPTGQRLVFNDKGAIRVTNVESSASRVVGMGLSPTWSPDGQWIAYRTGEGQIALMNAETGAIDARRFGVHLASFAHWSPDLKYAGEQRVSVEWRLAWGGYLLLRAVYVQRDGE
jgi:WD40 repeat protein